MVTEEFIKHAPLPATQRLAEKEAVEAQRLRLAELDSRRTVKAAFERWHELYLSKHRKDGGEFVKAMFDRHVLPAIGDRPIETLHRRDVADLLDNITAQGIRRTANMVLSLLRQFVRWCAARDWIERDPTLNLSKAAVGGKDKPRERTLSQLEIVELRDALPASGLPERMHMSASTFRLHFSVAAASARLMLSHWFFSNVSMSAAITFASLPYCENSRTRPAVSKMYLPAEWSMV